MAATGVKARLTEKLYVAVATGVAALSTKVPAPLVSGESVKVMVVPDTAPVNVVAVPSGNVITAVAVVAPVFTVTVTAPALEIVPVPVPIVDAPPFPLGVTALAV
jgi:hypothetical protein